MSHYVNEENCNFFCRLFFMEICGVNELITTTTWCQTKLVFNTRHTVIVLVTLRTTRPWWFCERLWKSHPYGRNVWKKFPPPEKEIGGLDSSGNFPTGIFTERWKSSERQAKDRCIISWKSLGWAEAMWETKLFANGIFIRDLTEGFFSRIVRSWMLFVVTDFFLRF